MFRSRARPVIIPQYEHGRLAGILAQHWGNAQFDRPALDFDAFVAGVAFHDWHYRFTDTLPIRGAAEAEWLAMSRRGLERLLDDPVADIVAKLHLRRLLTYGDSAERRAMIEMIDRYVRDRLAETDHTLAEFTWADQITRICDNVAFFFAFEEAFSRTDPVGARVNGKETVPVTFHIVGDGAIYIDPWPLAVPALTGGIVAFQAEGYPERLAPVFMPFHVRPPVAA